MAHSFIPGPSAAHALHLLSLVAMDEPSGDAIDPSAVSKEKLKVLSALKPASKGSFFLGRAREDDGGEDADPNDTEDTTRPPTFLACYAYVENRRW